MALGDGGRAAQVPRGGERDHHALGARRPLGEERPEAVVVLAGERVDDRDGPVALVEDGADVALPAAGALVVARAPERVRRRPPPEVRGERLRPGAHPGRPYLAVIACWHTVMHRFDERTARPQPLAPAEP